MFILATTEVHKVPLTIVSRCQRYDFRRLSLEAITDKLAELCAAEEVETGQDALDLIARHSTGSLRDAENLLEQAVVSYGSPLTVDQVSDMLDLSGDEDALDLCEMVVGRKVAEGLSLISRIADQGSDLRQLQRAVTEFLRAVMLITSGAGDSSRYSDATAERLAKIAAGADGSLVLRALRAFAEADMRQDVSSPLPLELALAESSLEPVVAAAPPPPVKQPSGRPAPRGGDPGARPSAPQAQQRRPPPAPRAAPRPAPARNTDQPLPTEPDERLAAVWPELLRALRNTGSRFKLGPLLRSAREYNLEDNRIVVRFAHSSHIERAQEEVGNPTVNRELKQAIVQAMGSEFDLAIELVSGSERASKRQTDQSHLVRAAQAMGARLVETIEEDTPQ
jgi:DNA polymerase-3 subunit gamma/tau